MSIPVGLSIPKLVPITASFALPLSFYYIFLSARVVNERLKSEKYIGDSATGESGDRLQAANRAQANFAENVPLALMLAGVAELNGAKRRVLTGALSALVVFRVLHAELGLMSQNNMGPGRAIGYFGTIGVIGMLSSWSAYLVRGYWGF